MGRDHNATSYSTETLMPILHHFFLMRRDHNATSYSTETITAYRLAGQKTAEIITLRAIALKPIKNPPRRPGSH